MNNDELIRTLATNLRPVRRLPSVYVRTACWAVGALGCVWFGALVAGTRADLVGKLHEAAFLREEGALVLVFLVSGWSAFQLSVPGRAASSLVRVLPFLGVLSWSLLLGARYSPAASESIGWVGSVCVWRTAGLALAPTLALVLMLRRALPLERRWTGLFAGLSASALATCGTQTLCAKDGPLHVLLWHLAPMLVLALVGTGTGGWLLRHPLGRA